MKKEMKKIILILALIFLAGFVSFVSAQYISEQVPCTEDVDCANQAINPDYDPNNPDTGWYCAKNILSEGSTSIDLGNFPTKLECKLGDTTYTISITPEYAKKAWLGCHSYDPALTSGGIGECWNQGDFYTYSYKVNSITPSASIESLTPCFYDQYWDGTKYIFGDIALQIKRALGVSDDYGMCSIGYTGGMCDHIDASNCNICEGEIEKSKCVKNECVFTCKKNLGDRYINYNCANQASNDLLLNQPELVWLKTDTSKKEYASEQVGGVDKANNINADNWCQTNEAKPSCFCSSCNGKDDDNDGFYTPLDGKPLSLLCPNCKTRDKCEVDCKDDPRTNLGSCADVGKENIDCNKKVNGAFVNSGCSACINPGQTEICTNGLIDNDCDNYKDMTLISSSSNYCAACCEKDMCISGSCNELDKACNNPPTISGTNLGIIYGPFVLTTFENPANCREGLIVGDQVTDYQGAMQSPSIKVGDDETNFKELEFFTGDDETNFRSGLVVPYDFTKDGKLPVEKNFWIKVTDKGVAIENSPASDPKSSQTQVNAILCPKGNINLGKFIRKAVWAGKEYNKELHNMEELWPISKGRIRLETNTVEIHISPDETCGTFNLDLDLEIKSDIAWGEKMMDRLKEKLSGFNINIFQNLAKKLPKKGDGLLKIIAIPADNPTSEKFLRATVSGTIGEEPIILDEYLTSEQSISLIRRLLSLSVNPQIECVAEDGTRFEENVQQITQGEVKHTTVECKMKDGWKPKGLVSMYPDGTIVVMDHSIFKYPIIGDYFIAYDQQVRIDMNLIDLEKFNKLLKCCQGYDTGTFKESGQISSPKNSLYFIRELNDTFDYKGVAYQFLPPYSFSTEVIKQFDISLFKNPYYIMEEDSLLETCNYEVLNGVSKNITQQGGEILLSDDIENLDKVGEVKQIFPENAVLEPTEFSIKRIKINNCKCKNNIKDTGELGIDCGGDCEPCVESCYDGIQNQNEEDVDCGGSCLPCDYLQDYEPNPICKQDSDCINFCGSSKPLCLYNTCSCLNSCGNNKCDPFEYVYNACAEDCLACDSDSDLDYDCNISLTELLKSISKLIKGDINFQKVLENINYWLS